MSRVRKFASGTISRVELGIFLDNFKIDILGNFIEQPNTLRIQNKQKVENVALSIFCPRCRKKYALHELPLDSVEIYDISAKNHDKKEFPSIPGLKVVFQDEAGTSQDESFIFISHKRHL